MVTPYIGDSRLIQPHRERESVCMYVCVCVCVCVVCNRVCVKLSVVSSRECESKVYWKERIYLICNEG